MQKIANFLLRRPTSSAHATQATWQFRPSWAKTTLGFIGLIDLKAKMEISESDSLLNHINCQADKKQSQFPNISTYTRFAWAGWLINFKTQ